MDTCYSLLSGRNLLLSTRCSLLISLNSLLSTFYLHYFICFSLKDAHSSLLSTRFSLPATRMHNFYCHNSLLGTYSYYSFIFVLVHSLLCPRYLCLSFINNLIIIYSLLFIFQLIICYSSLVACHSLKRICRKLSLSMRARINNATIIVSLD